MRESAAQQSENLEAVAATLPEVMPALSSGDLLPWLRLHELTGAQPTGQTLARFARLYLDQGRFEEALYAYELAGVDPDPGRLLSYARKYAAIDPERSARATYLASAVERREGSLRSRIQRWYEHVFGSSHP